MNITSNYSKDGSYKTYLQIIQSIRSFLANNGYLELDLPVLSPALIPEAYLEVFKTEFNYMDEKQDLFLTPSPELFIKRLLTDGIGDCYYMGKSFRNSEPHSPKHEPEFTMLEWYKVGKDYHYMADQVLKLLQYIAKTVKGDISSIVYQGNSISLEKWEKYTVAQAFEKYATIKPEILFNEKAFIEAAQKKGYITESFTYADMWSQMYAQEVEPHMGMNGYPTILSDYPVQFAALSKPNPDGVTAQRFEFYIAGLELGNCYTELTDASLQKDRFKQEHKEREISGKISHPVDWGFIESLERGMPDCTGIAIGVERLGMIFSNVQRIRDLQLINFS
jgi:EF-P lysine aminoacylase GenX